MSADLKESPTPLAEISQGPNAFEAFLDRNQKAIVVFAIALAIAAVAADELVARIHFMTGGVIHLLTHQEMLNSGAATPPSMEATLGRLIRFAAAGLREGTETEAPVKKGPQAMFDF